MKRLAVLTVILGAFVAAGVSAASAPTPYGSVFEAKITGQVSQLNGKWLLSFAANGTYAVVKEPAVKTLLVGGTSKITGNRIVLTDKTGPNACTGAEAHGTYTWSLTGKILRLTKVSDTCPGKDLVLGTAPFTKVG